MKNLLFWTAVSGALCVILGAFGAHGLKGKLDAYQMDIFEKGVTYQMSHTLAMLACVVLMKIYGNNAFGTAGLFFGLGIICFSGSLYLLAARDLLGLGSMSSILGPITPIGGLLMIIGWVMLAVNALKVNL